MSTDTPFWMFGLICWGGFGVGLTMYVITVTISISLRWLEEHAEG